MKRRYTILFFIALSPLIGMSWLGSTLGFSMWSMHLGTIGMVVGAAAAGYAAFCATTRKWPAVLALVTTLPMLPGDIQALGDLGYFMETIGLSIVLVFVGSLATAVAALVVTVLPVPPLPREPQVAPARVVD